MTRGWPEPNKLTRCPCSSLPFRPTILHPLFHNKEALQPVGSFATINSEALESPSPVRGTRIASAQQGSSPVYLIRDMHAEPCNHSRSDEAKCSLALEHVMVRCRVADCATSERTRPVRPSARVTANSDEQKGASSAGARRSRQMLLVRVADAPGSRAR